MFVKYFILFLLSSQAFVNASPIKLFDGFQIGVSEKGPHLNLINNLSDKNQFIFGIHYFEGNISEFDYSLVEPVPILFDSEGLKFSFKHFFRGSNNNSGLFTQFGLDLSSLKASSRVDLGRQVYDLGNVTMTCRSCGSITFKTDKNSFQVIPSLMFGWQKKINKNTSFEIGLGIQYIDVPKVIWDNKSNSNYPNYVKNKIDLIVNDANKEIQKYGNIIPTISISTNFYF